MAVFFIYININTTIEPEKIKDLRDIPCLDLQIKILNTAVESNKL